VVTGLSNVVGGWVDYYVTTTETPRESVIMSRRPDTRLSFVRPHAEANALLMAAPNGELANCDCRSLLSRSVDFQRGTMTGDSDQDPPFGLFFDHSGKERKKPKKFQLSPRESSNSG
jgi:hypothetical protein